MEYYVFERLWCLKTNIMKNKKYFTPQNIIIGILALLLLVALLGGGYGYKLLKDKINKEIKAKEVLIKDSQKRQDSISALVDYYISDADYYKKQSDKLDYRNKILNDELKRREKLISIRDSSFNNNARLITESVDRYYKGNDTIR